MNGTNIGQQMGDAVAGALMKSWFVDTKIGYLIVGIFVSGCAKEVFFARRRKQTEGSRRASRR